MCREGDALAAEGDSSKAAGLDCEDVLASQLYTIICPVGVHQSRDERKKWRVWALNLHRAASARQRACSVHAHPVLETPPLVESLGSVLKERFSETH